MERLAELVQAQLAKTGQNAFQAAAKGGFERSFVNDIVIGKKKSVGPKNVGPLAFALGCEPDDIYAAMGVMARPTGPSAPPIDGRDLVTDSGRDFPVYSAAEGGPGELIRTSDPVDWIPRPSPVRHVKTAYGQLVVGTSMEPEYEAGDTALVNPLLPLINGVTCIFYHEGADGQARATIKRLLRSNQTTWFVRQWNPPPGAKQDFTLDRREWAIAHRVFGKHTRL